jgi:hypothetical protein
MAESFLKSMLNAQKAVSAFCSQKSDKGSFDM